MEKSNQSREIVAGRGLVRDINRLKRDGGATAAEVREFVAQMKGRSPHDVLGMVAQSSLMHGVVVATVATLVLVAVFTVGPYLLAEPVHAKAKKPHAAAADAKADSPDMVSDKKGNTKADVPSASTSADQPAGNDPQVSKATLEKLGVDEVKQSDSSSNPLDRKDDDLLKELK
jgi:hypothetical protein